MPIVASYFVAETTAGDRVGIKRGQEIRKLEFVFDTWVFEVQLRGKPDWVLCAAADEPRLEAEKK